MDPNRWGFRYQLVGYDRGWIGAGSRRVAYYTHLPPGHYQFRAMANDGRGPWSEHGSVVSLVLHPRFMETVWFYMVLILVAVLVGALLVAARGRRIRARYERRIRARYATVLDER